jgi:hypothetical protein
MHARYPTKYNNDGTLNPKWKPRASGKMKSTFDRGLFVSWDGEGENKPNGRPDCIEHKYTLLSNNYGESIYNPEGLSTEECFKLLCDSALTHKHAIHVIYAGSYDINCMLRDILPHKLATLITEGISTPIKYKEYAITYTPRKSFTISRYRNPRQLFTKNKKGKFKPDYDVSFTLWDVIGFFQASFIETVEKWLGKDYIDYELILSGKQQRENFNVTDNDFIQRYNLAECKALTLIMGKLHKSLDALDLKVARWDGAGAIASKMCSKYDVKRALGTIDGAGAWTKTIYRPELQTVFQHGYFGGRIELISYGRYQGAVHHYDINSAYPFIQRNLPALTAGKWKHINKVNLLKIPAFSIIHVKWNLNNSRIYPFPYRSALQLKILYPAQGECWIWYPEVKSAFAVKNSDLKYSTWEIDLLEAWTFTPSKESWKPYEFIDLYYERRQALLAEQKTSGIPNGEEKVLKLGLNSLYGKTAQHIGFDVENGNIPPLHNLAYAGYVTSGTRAMIYKAVMTAPDSIIAIATDGIFSTTPLKVEVSDSKELGKWELKEHDGWVMVQAGFYWSISKGEYKGMSRGFDKVKGEGNTPQARKKDYQRKMDAQVNAVLSGWKHKEGSVYFPCTRFITLKSALVSDKWFTRWCCWYAMGYDRLQEGKQSVMGRQLKLSTYGTKRITDANLKYPYKTPDKGLFLTVPVPNYSPDVISSMYELPWDENEEGDATNEGLSLLEVEREHQESYI